MLNPPYQTAPTLTEHQRKLCRLPSATTPVRTLDQQEKPDTTLTVLAPSALVARLADARPLQRIAARGEVDAAVAQLRAAGAVEEVGTLYRGRSTRT